MAPPREKAEAQKGKLFPGVAQLSPVLAAPHPVASTTHSLTGLFGITEAHRALFLEHF